MDAVRPIILDQYLGNKQLNDLFLTKNIWNLLKSSVHLSRLMVDLQLVLANTGHKAGKHSETLGMVTHIHALIHNNLELVQKFFCLGFNKYMQVRKCHTKSTPVAQQQWHCLFYFMYHFIL